jgi:thiamine pyrophosphate-dependent acetolactate synthase large subunit-like protein
VTGDFAMAKRVADVVIETLQAAGVNRCYGIVGDTLNQIICLGDAQQ